MSWIRDILLHKSYATPRSLFGWNFFKHYYLYRGSVQLLHVLPSSDTRDQHGTQLFGNFTVSCPLVRPRAHCHNIFPGLGDKNNMVNLINLN